MDRREFLERTAVLGIGAALLGDSCFFDNSVRPRNLRLAVDLDDTSQKIVGMAHGSWTYDTVDMDQLMTDITSVAKPLCNAAEGEQGGPGFMNFIQLHFSYDCPSRNDPRIIARSGWKESRMTPGVIEMNTPHIMDERIEQLIEYAHNVGMGVMLKPHLSARIRVDGQKSYEDRARINFGTDEAKWREFFSNYEHLMRRYARIAVRQGVEIFSFACELQGTMHRYDEWRRITEAIREEGFQGKLIYAGLKVRKDILNRVHIMDEENTWQTIELSDYVCPHYYGPLGNRRNWTTRRIRHDFLEIQEFMSSLARNYGKPLLISETGMRPIRAQSARPWRYGNIGPWAPQQYQQIYDERMQTRWIDGVVKPMLEIEENKGVFWWDYQSDYTVRGRRGEERLREAYRPYACRDDESE